jgi:hypothetical protein
MSDVGIWNFSSSIHFWLSLLSASFWEKSYQAKAKELASWFWQAYKKIRMLTLCQPIAGKPRTGASFGGGQFDARGGGYEQNL